MRKLEGQELIPASQQSEYVRSHPLTRNRITRIKAKVEESKNLGKPYPKAWDEQHQRMTAKLLGYIQPEQVAWKYDNKNQTIAAQYARALSDYRLNKIDSGLQKIETLIALEPNNPFFYELKGQMLVDFGRVEQAIKPLQRAATIRPRDGLIRTALAHAQLELSENNQDSIQKAIKNLNIAAQAEPRSTRVHRLLATAHGRLGDDAYARFHLAEEALLQGKKAYARQQAEIALAQLPKDSAAAHRARDILTFTKNK